jgi:redox-sensitive bicupin YhaK (pirin superfamily)
MPAEGAAVDVQVISSRAVPLGGPRAMTVRRTLPQRVRSLIGAWCFVDHFGPLDFKQRKVMDVAPHPHIGLQTVSWLFSGEVVHNDSLGSTGVARPGTLNQMTAGRGNAHSQETPEPSSGHLHGVQLWVALPNAERGRAPGFDQYADLPALEFAGGRAQVFMGRLGGADAKTRSFSPLVGADITLARGGKVQLPLEAAWEHALLVVEGAAAVDGQALAGDGLHYLGSARSGLELATQGGARLLLIGGAPFGVPIVMWWNFVARTAEEIEAARDDWQQHRRFGDVAAYRGNRLDAPALAGRPVARG